MYPEIGRYWPLMLVLWPLCQPQTACSHWLAVLFASMPSFPGLQSQDLWTWAAQSGPWEKLWKARGQSRVRVLLLLPADQTLRVGNPAGAMTMSSQNTQGLAPSNQLDLPNSILLLLLGPGVCSTPWPDGPLFTQGRQEQGRAGVVSGVAHPHALVRHRSDPIAPANI